MITALRGPGPGPLDERRKLAPPDGIEPPTHRLTAGYSTAELRGNIESRGIILGIIVVRIGGAGQTRTGDILLAGQAFSR